MRSTLHTYWRIYWWLSSGNGAKTCALIGQANMSVDCAERYIQLPELVCGGVYTAS